MSDEILLEGGRVTAGVVRIGDTVRRPRHRHSDFVGALLDRLERRGFDAAPRYLGLDSEGRDALSFIEGETPRDLGIHGDVELLAAAKLIRAYHDATAEYAATLCAEVICHNDLSPCNFVFRDGTPVALIDFDAAAPGARLRDLGYAAWLWLDIGNQDLTVAEQSRRIRLFAAGYGADVNIAELVEAMVARQSELANEPGDAARTAWASDCRAWTLAKFAASVISA